MRHCTRNVIFIPNQVNGI